MPLHPTWHRAFQYVLILSITTSIGFGIYEWQKGRAAVKLNQGLEDSLEQGLVGYWKMDEGTGTTANDSSGRGNAGTLNAGPSWTTGQIGGAVNLDGVDDRVSLASPSTYNFTSSDFSAFMWTNQTGHDPNGEVFIGNSTFNTKGWILAWDINGTRLQFRTDQSGVNQSTYSSSTPYSLNQWNLIGFTRKGSSVRIYVNGVDVTSVTGTHIDPASTTDPVLLGAYNPSPTIYNLVGKMDETRIYNRALSGDEISRLYQTTAPTGIDTGLVGHWTFDGDDISGTTAYDRSGKGNNGTLTSGPTKTAGVSGQALSFSNNYVAVPSNSSLNPTSQITLSVWVKRGTVGTRQFILSKGRASLISDTQYWLEFTAGNNIVFELANGGTERKLTSAQVLTDTSGWHHIVGTYDGATQKIFVDGIQDSNTASWVGSLSTGGDELALGERSFLHGIPYSGSLDTLRIYSRALSTSEIQSLYNRAKPDIANNVTQKDILSQGLVGYWKMDETSGITASDASGNGNNGTLTNMEDPGDWVSGQIGNALSFGGTDEYVDIPHSTVLNSYPLTVSAWVNTSIGAGGIVNKYVASSGNGYQIHASGGHVYAWYFSSNVNYYIFSGAGNGIDGGVINDGLWHNVVFVVNANGGFLYVDNVLKGSRAWTGTPTSTSTTQPVSIGRYPVGSYFSGKIDEARIYNRALSLDEISRLYRTTGPTGVDTGLVSSWSLNSKDIVSTTAYDRSRGGNHGTVAGSPTRVAGASGQAMNFGGVSDYVSIGDPANLRFGATSFATSSWFKTTTSSFGYIVGDYASSNTVIGIGVNFSGQTNKGFFFVRDNTGAASTIIYTKSNVNDGKWHHIVGVRDVPAGKLRIYLDGIEEENATYSASASQATLNSWSIGRSGSQSSAYFNGYIDDARVYDRLLTPAEIQSFYEKGKSDKVNAASTDSLEQGLAGYWKLDEGTGTSAADASGNGNTGTLTNGPTWISGRVNQALDFSSASSHSIHILNSASLNPAYISISAWVKTSTTGTTMQIVGKDDPSGVGRTWQFRLAADKLQFIPFNQSVVSGGITGNTTITDGQWHHVVGAWDGVNQYLYVDGHSDATPAAFAGRLPTGQINDVYIGRDQTNTGPNYFNGAIDEIRIYNRALSGDEVTRLYRTTAPDNPDTGLVGYWPLEGKDISGTTVYDRSGKGNNGTSSGSPERVAGKIGQGLKFFPGGADANAYVSMGDPSSGIFDFGTGDFSVGMWMKGSGYNAQGSSSNIPLTKINNDSGGVSGYRMSYGASNILSFVVSDGVTTATPSTTTTTVSDNTWHHYFGVRSGGNVHLYVDGILVSTGTSSVTGSVSNSDALMFGGDNLNSRNTNASLDEVRIYNRALTDSEIKSLYNKGR